MANDIIAQAKELCEKPRGIKPDQLERLREMMRKEQNGGDKITLGGTPTGPLARMVDDMEAGYAARTLVRQLVEMVERQSEALREARILIAGNQHAKCANLPQCRIDGEECASASDWLAKYGDKGE